MARSYVHARIGGLDRFVLKENVTDSPDLADVTSVTVVVGSTTVYSTAYNDGPVRWNTSETRRGEIVALIPTAAFTADRDTAEITIVNPDNPGGLLWASQIVPVGVSSLFGQGGENREQCDVCGRWFRVSQLVRQVQIRRREARANYLYWSRYNAENWSVDTDALGEVSMGRSRVRWAPHTYKNANMMDGAQSFWGDGELVANDAVDLSTFTTALLRGRFGTHQMTKKPGLTIEFGFYYDFGGAGEVRYPLGSKEDVEGETAWIVDDLSSIAGGHISELQAFYKITTFDNQQIWWGEDFRLQKDDSAPGLTTAVSKGAPVVEDFQMKTFGAAVVCPDHRDIMPKQVNDYQPEFDPVEIIETEDQEF